MTAQKKANKLYSITVTIQGKVGGEDFLNGNLGVFLRKIERGDLQKKQDKNPSMEIAEEFLHS